MNVPAQQYAPSGLVALPALRWGSHAAHLFRSVDELHGVLAPFFVAGLENGERCLWLTCSEDETAHARKALSALLADFDAFEAAGQIDIREDAGVPDPDDALADLARREVDAVLAGFTGLRSSARCDCGEHGNRADFYDRERRIQAGVQDRRLIRLCSFQTQGLDDRQALDVVAAHDLVLGRAPTTFAATFAERRQRDQLLIGRTEADRPPALADHDFRVDIDAISAIGAVPVLLRIICQVTGLGFAAVARVTGERWVCLGVHDEIDFGMRPGDELNIATTFCQDIWRSRQGIVINDVAGSEEYRDHPTPALYGFQSYISLPILLRDGHFFGTLCAIDPAPNVLDTQHVIGMFRAFADLIAFQLESRRLLSPDDAKQLDARAVAELHDQLVTVLGHDLRNPISAIAAGASFLELMPLDEQARSVLDIIERSTARMSSMVDDVADFARSRLGEGVSLRPSQEGLDTALQQVVDELRVVHPDRIILADLDVSEIVFADSEQVARLASYLLVNALKYGDPAAPVSMSAVTNGEFQLSVANAGPPIPPDKIRGLFSPFVRGDVRPDQTGLGLGLYIVSEIARAHGGTIDVKSDAVETRFTFTMPVN